MQLRVEAGEKGSASEQESMNFERSLLDATGEEKWKNVCEM